MRLKASLLGNALASPSNWVACACVCVRVRETVKG